MNTNVIPFKFQESDVRVVTDGAGEPWFVARDVASLLGYTKIIQTISRHCKGGTEMVLPTAGGMQTLKVIPERDVYRLIMRSKLPAAEKFEEWVVGEVLPSIRKTGGYSFQQNNKTDVNNYLDANMLFRSFLATSREVFQGNQAMLSANMATRQCTGLDVLESLGATHLLADHKEMTLTPSDIAIQMGLKSGQAVNLLLITKGLQEANRDHKNRIYYTLTECGGEYAELLDTGKRNSEGAPIKQIKWKQSVIERLNDCNGEMS